MKSFAHLATTLGIAWTAAHGAVAAPTLYHQLASFEAGVPAFLAAQNGSLLTQETLGATDGSKSLGVLFGTPTTSANPARSFYMNIDSTNGNFAAWQTAATLQATTTRRFGVAYDVFLDFDGTSFPAGGTRYSTDFYYNQTADVGAGVPGFQSLGGELGLPTHYGADGKGLPTTDRRANIVIPFDSADNLRSIYVNPNASFYQLQVGNAMLGAIGFAKVYYDNFRIVEYNSMNERVLYSWETPDDAGTLTNEQFEGWGPGASAAAYTKTIVGVGATDGASALQLGTGFNAFLWGTAVNVTEQAKVNDLVSALGSAERIELDITFTGGQAATSYFSFFMHISANGKFYEAPVAQFNEIQNLGVGETRTVTMQVGLREFRSTLNKSFLVDDTLTGATSLALGIGSNEGAGPNLNFSIDKFRIISEAAAVSDDADFNDDGRVDGTDFLTWQQNLGAVSPTFVQGDADHNGVIDADDLAVWKLQFGTGAAGAAAAPVPEMQTLALAAMAIGSLSVCRRGMGSRR